jgi:glutamine amidotransferase/cyclase
VAATAVVTLKAFTGVCVCVCVVCAGDLVVTKGDQYDVREKEGEKDVRNLGKPVDLAAR